MLPQSVLLVEDNKDDEFLALRMLRKAGITAIRFARDGQEALDMLLASDQLLSEVVLLDLRLPLVDGLEVLAAIRRHKETKTLPVLVLTSSEDPLDKEVCSRLGVTAFLGKPLELSELRRALTTLSPDRKNNSSSFQNSSKLVRNNGVSGL